MADEPVITQQPEDVTKADRNEATFTVIADDPSGSGLSYEWNESGVGIAGSLATLSIPEVLYPSDDGRQFFCNVTNVNGTVQSDTVTLTVVQNQDVIYPGDLGKASYPSFFPCATWEYGQTISGHLDRTQFDSGWVRQRKRWREESSTVRLSFQMDSVMYEPWNRWMVNNGYEWFTMHLDRLSGGQVLSEVRLVGAIEYRYRPHDTIIVNVIGELGAPSFGPEDGPIDACQSYSCSALDDELAGQGVTDSIIGLGSTVDWDYPLAQTRPGSHGTPDMFSAWTEKVNDPTLIADWAANYPADNDMTGWGWYDEASKYGLCSGLAIRAMTLQGNDRIQDITPPTDLYVAAESSSAVAVVTGHAGGTQIGIDFQNGGAAVYQVVTRVYGADKYNDRMASLRTALSSDVNGVPTVSIYVGDGAGDSSGSVKSSAVDGQQWFNISLTESSWFEVITIDPYHYRAHKTATVTITSQDGFVDTTSVSGYIESYTAEGTGYYKSHTLVDPTPFNQTPGFFLGDDNRRVTLAYLAYGLVETDHTKISDAFLRNFTDYVCQ